MMLAFFLFSIVARCVLVSGECDVGDVKTNNFNWYDELGIGYTTSLMISRNNYDCLITTYTTPVANVSSIISTFYFKSNWTLTTDIGVVANWTNKAYHEHYFVSSIWNGWYYILGVDYKRYFIIRLCSETTGDSYTHLAFRKGNPDKATLEAAETDLKGYGLDLSQFTKWSRVKC